MAHLLTGIEQSWLMDTIMTGTPFGGLKAPKSVTKRVSGAIKHSSQLKNARAAKIRAENEQAAMSVLRHRMEEIRRKYNGKSGWMMVFVESLSTREKVSLGLFNSLNDKQTKRYHLLKFACPDWADLAKIKEVYELRDEMNKESSQQYEVDHIVPIVNDLVCGLHVHYNLQIIPRRENLKKRNKLEP